MRDKKYRLFNTIDKVMIDKPNSIRIVDGVMTCDDEDILIEYTGLKDKNGVEVFEGDIVEYQRGPGDEDHVAKVSWYKSNCCFSLLTSRGRHDLRNYYCMNVIGNIHSNPELLNGNRG